MFAESVDKTVKLLAEQMTQIEFGAKKKVKV
jgi:hypothetical protein